MVRSAHIHYWTCDPPRDGIVRKVCECRAINFVALDPMDKADVARAEKMAREAQMARERIVKRYTAKEKERAVARAKEIGVSATAKELGIPHTTLFGWLRGCPQKKSKVSAHSGDDLTPEIAPLPALDPIAEFVRSLQEIGLQPHITLNISFTKGG